MVILEDTTRDYTNLQWLKSESWKLGISGDALIDRPDLNDAAENQARSMRLQSYRSQITTQLPPNARYRHVRVEESDLPNLYILTVWDWFLDTGRTFELSNVGTHLSKRGRGGMIDGSRQDVHHFLNVMEKVPYVQSHDAETSDEHLILVTTHDHGPYTIIDGTHRASALFLEH